jgi:hypothetical protein
VDRNNEQNWKEYIVFDEDKFTQEQQKEGGDTAHAVMGIVRAPDDDAAQDTASSVSPGKIVFVRDFTTAPKEYVGAAEKMGYLNTSQAHHNVKK